ncbi:MAG: S-layer homology domain-containing protein [Vulcanimicrobiota bacterium]
MVKRWLCLCLVLWTTGAGAAPLFPDVSDAHWASDAVAALASKGLVEGYPDGTFKGDRAASRWEVAMVVARLLAKMEQQHQTFASKAELDQIRQLALALREELDALGVRVTNLEEKVGRLDRRVSELERITFYGSVDARYVGQTFSNAGIGDNDDLRNGGGNASNVPFLNYHTVVGTGLAATRRPQLQGLIPVVDFKQGKALTNGSSFTMRTTLGLNLRVSDDLDAGAEFSAFASQGDTFVDAYWGVSAPWLSNLFTANATAGAGTQPLNHVPYTRMNLDKFWVYHKPSKTRLTLGEIVKSRMDALVYAGQPNLGVYGPRRWAGYGFDLQGQIDLTEPDRLEWELLGTRFGNGNTFLGTNYENYVLAGNLAYHFHQDAGKIQLNYARVAEEAAAGSALLVGLGGAGMNVAYGASPGWSIRQWVNPPGYFAGQRSLFEQLNSGQLAGGVLVPNTVDRRPIAGWNGAADNAIGLASGGGNFGPQSQDTYGLTGRYRWDFGEAAEAPSLTAFGEWGHSQYRPNRNSPYSASGDGLRVGVSANLLDDALELGLEYLSIDPDYNPAAWPGTALGARFPRTMNFTGVWHPHDFATYPHNREGVRLDGTWRFDQKRGSLWAKASFLDQKQTSLYDVRVLPGGAGNGAPTFAVLGFSPGFVDPIFYGYAHPNLYGAGSGNSFTTNLQPLEDPRGSENSYSLGASYHWTDPGVRLSGSYGYNDFVRRTSLSPGLGGDQNHVDIDVDVFNLEAQWDIDKQWKLTGGLDYTRSAGHLDPGGLYHSYAVATSSSTFDNLDSTQTSPYVSVDWAINDKSDWNLSLRRYDTTDGIDRQVRAGTALDAIGVTTHPFEWEGWQVSSEFRLRF